MIQFQSATGNRVQGNFIGTDKTGSLPLPNGYIGVDVGFDASFNTIGVDGDGVDDSNERNIIAGNGSGGVGIWGSSHNTVAGNWIGVGLDGAPLGNTGDGIRLAGGSHFNQLEQNVISANSGYGIFAPSTWGVNNDNTIAGNYIGTDVTGTAAMGNGASGISLDGSANTVIGGTTEAERNVIADSGYYGIWVRDFSDGTSIQGNYIGTDASGTVPLGNNSSGVYVENSADTIIGGSEPGAGNVIANNARDGVCVVGDDTAGNSIRGNSIYANGELGIDLGDDGPTPNDDGDVDVGPNNLQNFPVISRVESGPTTRLVGTFNGAAGTTFKLDFYANSEADPSGFGEGERWLGWAEVITDSEGNADFNVLLAAATVSGEVITATATAPDGSTSEFSGADVVARPPVLIDVMPGSDLNPVNLVENGVIPVAILTTDSFDASWVNASTVVFAGASAVHSALEDVDGDGDLDMILHFEIQETNLAELYAQLVADDPDGDGVLNSNHQTAAVSLTGLTATDEYFEGFDEVDLFLSGKNLRDFLEDLAEAGAI